MVCENCSKSWWRVVACVLVVIGGLNWGLVGLGMLFGAGDWNVVRLILGGAPVWEAIVYLLVGIAAVVKMFNCGCGKKASAPAEGQAM